MSETDKCNVCGYVLSDSKAAHSVCISQCVYCDKS